MTTEAQRICLECGLCCNGVIFARGQLQAGEDAEGFRQLGFKLRRHTGGVVKFAQPCPALECGACRVYESRPQYCREFDCALLKGVVGGVTTAAAAAKAIASARRLASQAERLLRELGEDDNAAALAVRFRRLSRYMESQRLDGASSHSFGELTVTMHKLNMLLSENFYPGT